MCGVQREAMIWLLLLLTSREGKGIATTQRRRGEGMMEDVRKERKKGRKERLCGPQGVGHPLGSFSHFLTLSTQVEFRKQSHLPTNYKNKILFDHKPARPSFFFTV